MEQSEIIVLRGKDIVVDGSTVAVGYKHACRMLVHIALPSTPSGTVCMFLTTDNNRVDVVRDGAGVRIFRTKLPMTEMPAVIAAMSLTRYRSELLGVVY